MYYITLMKTYFINLIHGGSLSQIVVVIYTSRFKNQFKQPIVLYSITKAILILLNLDSMYSSYNYRTRIDICSHYSSSKGLDQDMTEVEKSDARPSSRKAQREKSLRDEENRGYDDYEENSLSTSTPSSTQVQLDETQAQR